jgi:superfamily II RNA helicase
MGVTEIEKVMGTQDIPNYYKVVRHRKKRKVEYVTAFHFNLIRDIRDRLPAIFFVFSRKECQSKALELVKKFNFLSDLEKKRVAQLASELIGPEYRSLQTIIDLKVCLNNGIAFHHAGLLPRAKELVEVLFAEGIIKVLYATETFAVGINMPAKSVAFSSVYKYDGVNFRYLFTKEYFQMAGRAGRRGIDKQGDVFVMIDRNKDDLKRIQKMQTKDVEPIMSQFQISFNTVLNMMRNYDAKTREQILSSSFFTYQRKKEKATANIKNAFNNKVRTLQKVGFIQDDKLTPRGVFASKIYDREILVTDLFASQFYKELSVEEMVALCSSIIYEYDRRDDFEPLSKQGAATLIRKVEAYNPDIFNHLSRMDVKKLYHISVSLCRDVEFSQALETTSLQEGDLIRLFRRTIDLLRQIRNATSDNELMDRCTECINAIQKPPIKVEF